MNQAINNPFDDATATVDKQHTDTEQSMAQSDALSCQLAPDHEEITLDTKYTSRSGRVFMNGTQALVRLPLIQKLRDEQDGLNTAGFISGYRGSPLGNVDLALWSAKKHLEAHDIVFQPGLNEDLAATSVWGTQQLNLFPEATREGVFAMWYGKGPGLDRSMDVFKHANNAGTGKHGGVLLIAGDDHGAKSSTVAYQSEHILQAAGIPVLYPSSVQEYLDFGIHGWAMSRYSGLWVSMKCVTDVVESSASVDIDVNRVQPIYPEDFELPADGLNIRWPDTPLAQEERLNNYRWYAALAYVRANKIDRIVFDSPNAKFGIMTAGKAYLDVRQALIDLGLDEKNCTTLGIRLYKVGCVWPLEAQGAREFATGLDEILVVEEKRQIMEYAIKEELYNWRDDVRPEVYGKYDAKEDGGGEWSVPRGPWLLPPNAELSPAIIAKAIAQRLLKRDIPAEIRATIEARIAIIRAKEKDASRISVVSERKPWFCSGCPHNTSTRVPEGSRAVAGIGCHYMTIWMDRNTETFTQMGGEGVTWLGQQHFTNTKHIFANLGDGTYFHSGILAIRAAIAAKANITYRILYNDAVAMTGGQPVDGTLTVPMINASLVAEGVKKVVIVTDEPEKYKGVSLVNNPEIRHRDDYDAVMDEMRKTPGTTIIIYDQTCATEKRRRRKRGTYPDPARRVFINDEVCEGCGDCSEKSHCLSVEPYETPLGTKRQINQSSCNKDFSCLKGFCPSFVTAEGAQMLKPKVEGTNLPALDKNLPAPQLPEISRAYNILVPGVGGTGVVTVGAILGMAAHLECKGVHVLDITGLAQKGGAVISHVQIGKQPTDLYATRIGIGEADVILGCDSLVAASKEITSKAQKGRTWGAINQAKTPTAEIIANRKWRYPTKITEHDIQDVLGEENVLFFDANRKALKLLGDTIYANPLLMGFAWQHGKIPLHYESIMRAFELNNVSVEKNKEAFNWGRHLAVHGPDSIDTEPVHGLMTNDEDRDSTTKPVQFVESLDALIERLSKRLVEYQNQAYADRFKQTVASVRAVEQRVAGNHARRLTQTVARNLHKLMAYKDEYEVARLYLRPEFFDRLRRQFEGEPGKDYQLYVHLSPPSLKLKDGEGAPRKKKFGPYIFTLFKLLSKMKFLRGTAFDPFGRHPDRVLERRLITEYLETIEQIIVSLNDNNYDIALELANYPDDIRGYGYIKEKSVEAIEQKREKLLKQLISNTNLAA